MRRFTRTISALSLAALIACDGGTTEPEPEPEPEPVTAVITGPTDAYISSGSAPVEFRSVNSKGDITDEIWTIIDDDAVESEPVSGSAFSPQVTEPGSYRVRLQVKGEGVEPHDTTHLLDIYPEIGLDFPAPMAFARYTGSGSERTSTLHTFDPRTGGTKLLSEQGYNDARLSWSPDGRYLALSVHSNASSDDIAVLDTQTGEHYAFTDHTGVAWMPAWNPKKDVIAFTDDFRTPNRSRDELFFVMLNPDDIATSQVYSPAGETTDSTYYGWFPSWSPDGELLAVGNAQFLQDGESVRRMGVFSDILGEPSKERLVPEDSLLAFIEGTTGRTYPSSQIQSGAQGVGWSPDGRWVAYNLMLGFVESGFHNLLVKAAADGSGTMRLINDFAGPFTWSPDGNSIYFNNSTITNETTPTDHILRVHSGGGSEVEDIIEQARRPAWYNH